MKKKQQSSSEGGEAFGPRQTPEEVLTLEEAARWLKLRPGQVYELTRRRCRRPLPALKVGKALRFRLSAIDQWLAQK
jgi:excisionase family DNA binding protein